MVNKVAYKVVTRDMRSLGLRNNPNIIQYPIRKWFFLSNDQIRKGKQDFGGIWCARTLGKAKGLQRYMKRQHFVSTRIFKVLMDRILYANDYRIKTNGLIFLEEIS